MNTYFLWWALFIKMNKINAPWLWRVHNLIDELGNHKNYCTVCWVPVEINAQNDDVAHCIYSGSWQDRSKIFADLKRWAWVTKVIFLNFKNLAEENKKEGSWLCHLLSFVTLDNLLKLSEIVFWPLKGKYIRVLKAKWDEIRKMLSMKVLKYCFLSPFLWS